MRKHWRQAGAHSLVSRLCAMGISIVTLMILNGATVMGQGKGVQSLAEIASEVSGQGGEINRLIERSNGYFQSAELNFKDGNFDRARREYDRAIDILLESGIDIRSNARAQNYYQSLVDKIFNRQMTLMAVEPMSVADMAQLVAQGKGKDGGKQSKQDDRGDRGFGQQFYTASPLDDMAKLDLNDDETKGVTDEEAEKTVEAAKLDFKFKSNALIQSYINYYKGRGRNTMELGLRRSGRYIEMAKKIFAEEGVPQDIVWLCQVESAWSPRARSWAAAVGLWQFMPATGARYGLRQDYYVDERSSFEKATRASARYLKFLNNRYDGNWELAMAAYNSGEGRIDNAINRSGQADFWHVHSRGMIPSETKNYVPNILAVIIIAKDPARYGFNVSPETPLNYDYVKVNNMVDLKLVADATDVPFEHITNLNPELKRGLTPPGTNYMLRVPNGKGENLVAALKRIPVEKRTSWRLVTANNADTFETIARKTGVSAYAIEKVNGGLLATGQKVVVPAGSAIKNVVALGINKTTSVVPEKKSNRSTSSSSRAKTYTVKGDESLGDIAGRYAVSAREIAQMNKISSSSRLRRGQVLRIPVN